MAIKPTSAMGAKTLFLTRVVKLTSAEKNLTSSNRWGTL